MVRVLTPTKSMVILSVLENVTQKLSTIQVSSLITFLIY
jgi:hypothetical protein